MAKKLTLIILGVVLLLCGLGAFVPGVVLAALAGGDDTIASGYHTLSTSTPALISETSTVSSGTSVPTSGLGSTDILLSARNTDQPIFLGVGRAADVDDYLNGVAADELRSFRARPYRVETDRRSGSPAAAPPGRQSFWVASATGREPKLDWKVTGDGDYRLVMMNADGSSGVRADVQFGIKFAGLFGIGIGTLIAGMVIAVVGVVLIIWGIRTPAKRPQPAPVTGYPGGPPGSYPAAQPPAEGGTPPAPPPSAPPMGPPPSAPPPGPPP